MRLLAEKTVRMTVDEYLRWSCEQSQRPRHELLDGTPYAMSPERARHALTKAFIFTALHTALTQQKMDCIAFPDGMTVKVDEYTAFEPDALVTCGQKIAGDDIIIENPLIIVEVLSPGTKYIDAGEKLSGYFQIESVRHYLMVDPLKKNVVHHERNEKGIITTHIIKDGSISLHPPGIKLALAKLFEADGD